MTDNITSLRGNHPAIFKRDEPNQELIEQLEAFLESARSGHMRAVAYAYVDADRAIHTGWEGHCDAHDMTCGVSKLFYRYLKAETLADEND